MLFSVGLPAFVLAILCSQTLGQDSVLTFTWSFGPVADKSPGALPICQAIPLDVFPNPRNSTNFTGIPPYYMMAFPENGQPITSLVRNDSSMLSWTPTHPVGTKIILQLIDSTGSTGGSDSNIFNIVENPNGNTDCAAPPPTAYFFLSSNITQDGQTVLQTCQPWRLNINGGEPPYTLILDATSSPVLMNLSVPVGNDAVVYINRADPDTVLFAAAVDRSGKWATGTQFAKTGGSEDVTCTGERTVVTSQDQLNIPDQKAFKNRRRLLIIACITAGLISLMLIVGGFGISSNIRQKRLNKANFLKLSGGRLSPSLSPIRLDSTHED